MPLTQSEKDKLWIQLSNARQTTLEAYTEFIKHLGAKNDATISLDIALMELEQADEWLNIIEVKK